MQSTESVIAQVLFHQEYLIGIERRQVIDVPDASSVVMIGPHPDDIVLGCGGTAIKYRRRETPLAFCCLTDGRACVTDSEERLRMIDVRAKEEREAALICGVEDVELIGFPEDRFTEPGELSKLVSAVGDVMDRHKPDALFVPYWFEMHPWHRYTNTMISEVLKAYAPPCTVYAYEVLSLVPPQFIVDISDVLSIKQKAVEAYASQMQLRDYVRDMLMIGGLHARLISTDAVAAEVFQSFEKLDYIERVQSLGLDRQPVMESGIQPVKPEG